MLGNYSAIAKSKANMRQKSISVGESALTDTIKIRIAKGI